MVTCFGSCCVDGRGALQNLNRPKSCKMGEEMGKSKMLGGRVW